MGHQSSKLSTEPLPVEGSAGTTGTAGFNLREKGFAALRDSHIAREHDAERVDSDIDEDLAIMPLRLQDQDVASPLQLANSDIKDLADPVLHVVMFCLLASRDWCQSVPRAPRNRRSNAVSNVWTEAATCLPSDLVQPSLMSCARFTCVMRFQAVFLSCF